MNQQLLRTARTSTLPTVTFNRVLRNTYALLSMLFLFGAYTAWFAMKQGWYIPFWPFLIGIFAFSFAIHAARNSGWGILLGFGFSGFLGVVTGANVNFALSAYSNGGMLVVSAFALTAVMFLTLSAYAMVAKRDFSGWVGFLAVGTLAVIGAFVINYFLQVPALWLALSTMIILLACGWILWQTQQIVRGGQTNYILAATGLLADIFVLFNNLLALLGFGFGED
ncbi:MAG: Bax inhibitor-1 family protein [Xanthomonadales bacterium]|nr:Bax inhibitor-1 family protein [Xanthomonadales bacterium]